MIKLLVKNKLTIIVAIAILYLSFANASTFSTVSVFDFPHIDKVVHFCMYFGLMLVIQIENSLYVKKIRGLLLISIFPLLFGIGVEFCQSWLTVTRSGDIFDALFNFVGILVAALAWRQFIKFMDKRVRLRGSASK